VEAAVAVEDTKPVVVRQCWPLNSSFLKELVNVVEIAISNPQDDFSDLGIARVSQFVVERGSVGFDRLVHVGNHQKRGLAA
jgi:hypothetical protein